jgi:flavodoxin
MKTLVVYYSRSGISKMVATTISNALKCDTEEIIDTKNRSGFMGWLMAGRDATLQRITRIKDIEKDLSTYDTVIIGGPVWASNICPAVRTFLLQYMDQVKNVAFFSTTGGSNGERSFKTMGSIIQKTPLAKLSIKWADVHSGKFHEKVSAFVDQIRTK